MTQAPAITIAVSVTYAGSRKGPFKEEFGPTTTLAAVRQAAIHYFEVADGGDGGGNQIVFNLVHGDHTIKDLNRTVAEEADNEHHLQMRLVREVIAG